MAFSVPGCPANASSGEVHAKSVPTMPAAGKGPRYRFRRPRDYVELSTPAAPSLFDGPPSLSTEGHLIKYVLVVVVASLLGSRRRLRHRVRVLSMRLLLVPQWRGGHSIC